MGLNAKFIYVKNVMLSIIIPSYKDPYLQKTIDSLIENAEGEIEIIAVYNASWPNPPLVFSEENNKKVIQLHLGENRGMRGAINAGVAIAKGKYLMRTDSHCVFGKGYDRILIESCQPNWIMTAKRFFLDPIKWEVMDVPPVNYERLVIQSAGKSRKFTGLPTENPSKEMISETQAMQGSMWFMHREWWDKVIGELQTEGYGPHLQDSHEMVFKTWKAGGKLMMNQNTWYAHKHVSFERTHNYGGEEASKALQYSYETWIDFYKELKEKWKQSQS